jgi:hypothetical protein
VKVAFDQLYEEWLRSLEDPNLRHSSRPADYVDHPAYEGIVQMGEEALPLIVEKLKEGQFFLNTAMERITEIDLRRQMPLAVSEQEMARQWVRWWENRPADEEVPQRTRSFFLDGLRNLWYTVRQVSPRSTRRERAERRRRVGRVKK